MMHWENTEVWLTPRSKRGFKNRMVTQFKTVWLSTRASQLAGLEELAR